MVKIGNQLKVLLLGKLQKTVFLVSHFNSRIQPSFAKFIKKFKELAVFVQ